MADFLYEVLEFVTHFMSTTLTPAATTAVFLCPYLPLQTDQRKSCLILL